MAEHPLKKHERRLAEAVHEARQMEMDPAKETASSLKKYAHEEEKHAQFGDQYNRWSHREGAEVLHKMSNDTSEAHKALKAYGSGHDMTQHGEGKPHRGK